MSYRLLKFSTVYPEFTRRFLADNPNYSSLSYTELNERFVATHYGWADYYANALNALGCEAQDIFADIEPLQKAWASEHGIKYRQDQWQQEIVLAQAKLFRPDVLFLQDLYFFHREFRARLREICGKRVLLIGWHASPIEDLRLLNDLDLVLSCAPHYVDYVRRAGAPAELLLHAFDPSVLASLPAVQNTHLDFTFVGSFVLRPGFHQDRFATVRRLMTCTPLHVWGELSWENGDSRKARVMSRGWAVARRLSLPMVEKLQFAANERRLQRELGEYRNRVHEPLFGLSYFELLAKSKLTFNSHIEAAEQYAGNMRLFEATGVGACLITDWKPNLAAIFEPDVEVVTYRSVEECRDKVRYLLEDENKRRAIAQAGQRKTLRCHTFSHRALQLDELIRQKLA